MKARLKENAYGTEARLMDIEELRAYTNLGKNKAMELGIISGSKIRIGRRVLYDRQRVDDYIDSIAKV